ncbi:O-antigen ligase family protein [Blastococcus sp. SYSU DS0533]
MSAGGLRARVPAPIVVALFLAATIDIFRVVPVAGTTGLGMVTAAAALVVVLLGLTLVRPDNVAFRQSPAVEPLLPAGRLPSALWLFLAWALLSLAVNGTGIQGLQNLSVYALFVVGAAATAAGSSAGTAALTVRLTAALGVAITLVYLAGVVLQGLGANVVYGPRSYALVALVLMAPAVPLPRDTPWRFLQWSPYLVLVGLAASLSRTAGAAALLILLGRVVRGRRRGRLLRASLALVAAMVVAVWAVVSVPTLNDRVFGGDRALEVGDVAINTEGRIEFWGHLVDGIPDAAILGHGPGSSSDLLVTKNPEQNQPHNDYLRLLYDYGAVGLALWCVGYAQLLVRCWRRARAKTPDRAAVHYGAALALVAVALSMLTDNAIIYPFVMAPLGVLVGVSLAGAPPADAGASRSGTAHQLDVRQRR